MSSSPQILPARGIFQPRYILPDETTQFGLPDANRQPNVLSLVDAASALIDVHCGRVDGTGQGSLVYTTYMERLLLQARGRNLVRASFRPLIAIDASTVNLLTASANNLPVSPQTNKKITGNPLLNTNYFWTGCRSNSQLVANVPGSTISPIIGCSGRYGYPRRSEFAIYPDLNYGMNPLMIASFFGGPPTWTPIDLSLNDFSVDTGELWLPAGLYLSQYTEIVVVYNSGYHPLFMPPQVKQATAMLVRNFLSRAGGVSGLRSISVMGASNVSFTPDLIDGTIERILDPFKTVIAY